MKRRDGKAQFPFLVDPNTNVEMYESDAIVQYLFQIPYRLHNVARGSPGRDAFVRRSGKMMVPFLGDPNTGQAMFESADIVRYLDDHYGEPK